ncbi:uncharacterized protein B0H18DRAFT_1127143 [Fomitopsis serialis]|uniref:uncharacterized protein n=1 Tax=Fomitopsis serialis TaxID=139415 RepID=UPI002007CFBD|nr:uncharacterized protein B0H18DRAFT_1127143 [Neoantrodia serialis]KAH9912455.1 hypothetical protein B0H18DRAFT_1127143 [Neoantrodia serialis]
MQHETNVPMRTRSMTMSMNLKSSLEESDYAFGMMSIASLIIAGFFSWNGPARSREPS